MSGHTRAAYEQRLNELRSLPIASAKRRALDVLRRWNVTRSRTDAPAESAQALGPVTREFFKQFREVRSPNDAHVIGTDLIAPSQYIESLTAIGRSDYMDMAVRNGDDEIFVVDGSEDRDALKPTYPSIYHLIIDFGD